MRGDLAGLAVHIGARIAALAKPGEVLVSPTVKDLVVQSGIRLTDRGTHSLKGVPGRWQLFAAQASVQNNNQLVPTRREHAPWSDRIAIGFSRRTPAIVRSLTRAAQWRPRHSA